jgi:hypothetical protein
LSIGSVTSKEIIPLFKAASNNFLNIETKTELAPFLMILVA